MTLFNITLVLFLIIDPIGNISPYLSLVKKFSPKKQRHILVREMLIALTAMLIFCYLGKVIFDFLQLSETTVRLSSGIILFIIALQILFPNLRGIRDQLPKGEPFIIPLAIPLIAGPSLLATIMLYAHMEQTQSIMLAAILFAWAAAALVLFSSGFLNRILGIKGLLACENLMGMVLILLAMQRFLDGVEQFMITFAGS